MHMNYASQMMDCQTWIFQVVLVKLCSSMTQFLLELDRNVAIAGFGVQDFVLLEINQGNEVLLQVTLIDGSKGEIEFKCPTGPSHISVTHP